MTRLVSIAVALAAAAFGQSGGLRVVSSTADALGGKDGIMAIRTLVMEGSGVAPNIGQNPFPEGPLPCGAQKQDPTLRSLLRETVFVMQAAEYGSLHHPVSNG